MRKSVVLAALLMCCSMAKADITLEVFSTTQLPSGNWLWTYEATLSPDARIEGDVDPDDYFTIYDFDGYILNSISTAGALHPGWVGSVDNDARDVPGTTPGQGQYPADNLGILNLIFTYTGGDRIEGGETGASLGLFSAESQFGPGRVPHLSSYVAQTTNNTGTAVDGRALGNIGTVATPTDQGDVIPEPGSMALLGTALLGLGALRARRRK